MKTRMNGAELKKTGKALMHVFLVSLAVTAVFASWAAAKDSLGPDERLRALEELRSADGQNVLVLQADGNLVAYNQQRKILWASNTMGSGAAECVMQPDGNLVLYNGSGKAVWAAYTDGWKNSRLVMQNDGNLVLYNSRGVAVWAQGLIKNSLAKGETLAADEFIRSQNRKYTLKMQADGNLVSQDSQGKIVWSSNTHNSGAVECLLQTDGNLVLRGGNGKAVWASNTSGYSDTALLIQDDGIAVLRKASGIVIWANGTMNINVQPDTTRPSAPAAGTTGVVRHQDDAGSGRDAGADPANAVPIRPESEPADGELTPGDDVDIYSIRLEQGWQLLLKLMTMSQQDYDLVLAQTNGDIVASSARGIGQSESLDFTAPSSGMYYVGILRKAGQGHYKFEFSIHK